MTKTKIIILIFFLLSFISNKSLTLEIDQLEIESKEIITKKNNTIIEASGDALVKDNFGRKITGDKIIYFRDKSKVEAIGKAKFSNLSLLLLQYSSSILSVKVLSLTLCPWVSVEPSTTCLYYMQRSTS